MVGVSLNNQNKADDKEQLVGANSTDVLVTVLPMKDELPIPLEADVRRKQASILFGCLSALFMLGCLVIGTWLLFDFINRTNHTWHQTCRFRVKPMGTDNDAPIFFDHGGLTAVDDGKNQILKPVLPPKIQQEFQQEVNVDLKKNLETIEVPQIGATSTVRIIEDFDHSGQFLPDNEVLRKTMKVQTPALTEADVEKYGPIVSGTCPKEIKTYRLVPKTAEEMKNRRRRSPDSLSFMYSVGAHAIMFDIDH
ncbi:unnamed protein product [Rotaria socialis]|uniref:Integral membrane protein 2 n=1 Tax=Rotaria socialis TaxID=392032 RepID=A0A820ZN48_9BILA|nr:unnamed protein product [Rotaria socialis]